VAQVYQFLFDLLIHVEFWGVEEVVTVLGFQSMVDCDFAGLLEGDEGFDGLAVLEFLALEEQLSIEDGLDLGEFYV